MSTVTISEALKIALRQQEAGRFQEAERICRQVLQQEPGNADAIHQLGLLAHRMGHKDTAVDLLRRSVELSPNTPAFHVNFGEALRVSGRPVEAEAAFQQALRLDPKESSALNNLGVLRNLQGQTDEAMDLFRQSLRCNPSQISAAGNLIGVLAAKGRLTEALAAAIESMQANANDAMVYNNVGWVLAQMERVEEAVRYYERSVAMQANATNLNNLASAYFQQGRLNDALATWRRGSQMTQTTSDILCNLGMVLRVCGQVNEAVHYLQKAVAMNPAHIEAYNQLGLVYSQCNRADQAVHIFHQALERKPDAWDVYNNLGAAMEKLGRIDDAIAAWERAVHYNPRCGEAWNNIAGAWKEKAELDKALWNYRKALEANPTLAPANSNMLLVLHYCHGNEPELMIREHQAFNRMHGAPLAKEIRTHGNAKVADRRLRIGYISGDFRNHAVATFVEPILAHHDRRNFEVFCYSDVVQEDRKTQDLQKHADHWISILGQTDEVVAEKVRQDGIDLLVDLSGHTALNRMLVFARKPAPVQVSYLGYQNTTGLSTIDYRISDGLVDPPGVSDGYYTEKLYRLPKIYACFQPPRESPEVGPLPAGKNGYVTFACFSKIAKITAPMMELWVKILQAVDNSRLVMMAPALSEASLREHLTKIFENFGMDMKRVEMRGGMLFPDYLEFHNQVDLMLETFPFNGHTTTCEGLWMGVPIVTLAGKTYVTRMAMSNLINLNLPELVAYTPEDYVRLNVELARDPKRLAELRAGMRQRMMQSPICDAAQFTKDLEEAYRKMWVEWCGDKKVVG